MGILLTDSRTTTTGKYVYQPYPKFVEHPDGRCCVVNTIEAHRALGEGWPKPAAPELAPEQADSILASEPPPLRRRGRKPKA